MLIVDDHSTFAELLAGALDREPDLSCVGHAPTAAEGVALAGQLRPDVVVMDLRLPDMDGFAGTQQIQQVSPDSVVVILTAHAGADLIARAVAVGASGLLPKDGSLSAVLGALRGAHRGGMIVHPSLLPTVPVGASDVQGEVRGRYAGVPGHGASARSPGGAPELTARERDVLALMAEGLDVTRISRTLRIAESTCRGYVKSVLAKLDAHTQLEAVVKAVRLGLVSLDRG